MKLSSLFVLKYYLNVILIPYFSLKYQFQGWIFDNYFEFYYLDNYRFYIPKDITTRSYRGAQFIHSNYEKDERGLINYIDTKSTILELGGGIGILSCIINKHLVNPTQHLVIEANPLLIPILKKNKQLNNALFKIENTLVSNQNNFYANHKAINASSAIKKRGEQIKVPLTKIENLQRKYHLKFDTAIIDIEGSEIDLIKENVKFLNQVKILMIEFHPQITGNHAIQESKKILRNIKFRLVKEKGLVELWKRTRI